MRLQSFASLILRVSGANFFEPSLPEASASSELSQAEGRPGPSEDDNDDGDDI